MTYHVDNKRALEFSCCGCEEETLAQAVLSNDVGQVRKLLLQQGEELSSFLSGDFGSCLLCVVFEYGSLEIIDTFKEFNLDIQNIAWHGYDASSHGPFVSTRFSGIAMASFSLERLQFLIEHDVLHPLQDKSGIKERREYSSEGKPSSSTCLSMGLCYNNDEVYQYLKKWYLCQYQGQDTEEDFSQVLGDMFFQVSNEAHDELKDKNIVDRMHKRIEDVMDALYEKTGCSSSFPPGLLQYMTQGNRCLTMLMWERHLRDKTPLFLNTMGGILISQERLVDFSCVLPFMPMEGVMECMSDLADIVDSWAKKRPEVFHHLSYVASCNIVQVLDCLGTRLEREGFMTEQQMIRDILEDGDLWTSSYGRDKDDDNHTLEKLCLNLRLLPQSLHKTVIKKKM